MSLTILQLTSPIKINSEPRYIVMENVIDFRESGVGTKLTFISGRSEEVKEKPKEILKKIAQLNKSIKSPIEKDKYGENNRSKRIERNSP